MARLPIAMPGEEFVLAPQLPENGVLGARRSVPVAWKSRPDPDHRLMPVEWLLRVGGIRLVLTIHRRNRAANPPQAGHPRP